MVEVPQVAAQDLLVSTRTDPASLERLLGNNVLLFGLDCTSEDSCSTAYSLLVALSDETHNRMPVAFVPLKTDLGTSSTIRKKVRYAACPALQEPLSCCTNIYLAVHN
jgi:hypothetical protein